MGLPESLFLFAQLYAEVGRGKGREGKGRAVFVLIFSFFLSVLKNCLLLHGELKICCDCVSFG